MKIKDFLLEVRLEKMGIKKPGFISMIKDYSGMAREEKKAIIEAYCRIKKSKEILRKGGIKIKGHLKDKVALRGTQ